MRKGQFFIATIVLIAVTLSLTTINLYIPQEIDITQTTINDEVINNALFVKQTLNEVNEYFKINWLMPYTHRTRIIVESDFKIIDHTVHSIINLPNNAYINSLYLVDENNQIIDFNVDWTYPAGRQGILFFQASAEALEDKSYYLYYSILGGDLIKSTKNSVTNYTEDGNHVTIKTQGYFAKVDKSKGGQIEVIKSSNSDDYLTSFTNLLICNSNESPLEHSIVKNFVSVEDKDYFVRIEFNGTRFQNETFKVIEYFFPDRIWITDEMRIADESRCNWSTRVIVNKNILPSYTDSEVNAREPATIQSWTEMGIGTWVEFYDNGSGLGFSVDNESPILASSDVSENRAEFRFDDGGELYGLYILNTTLIPLTNFRLNQTNQFHKPSTKVFNEVFNTEFNNLLSLFDNYFYDINSIVTYESDVGVFFESFKNISDWKTSQLLRNSFTIKGPSFIRPIEASLFFTKNIDPNSIRIYDQSMIQCQVSTDNYHDSSQISSINNSGINNTLILFNPNGQDFNITVIKENANDLSATLNHPNGSPEDFNVNASPYDIILKSVTSGFFNITFNGSNGFEVNTTIPKLIAKLPVKFSAVNSVYLMPREGAASINLIITTYTDDEVEFKLYDPWNNTVTNLSRGSPGTSNVNAITLPCIDNCVYRLDLNKSIPFKIESANIYYASGNEKYVINPLKPELVMISVTKPGDLKVYFDNTTQVSNQGYESDLNYSEDDFEVNNSFISFDVDDIKFFYQGVEWFGSRGWTTCVDSCTNSFSNVKFVEKGSERVVVKASTIVGVDYFFHFYPNVSYFKVIVESDTNYSFGPNWRINNTDDIFYSYSGSDLKVLGDNDKVILRYDLEGPRSFVSKSDHELKAAVVFDSKVLVANESIKINDNSIIIKAYQPSTYEFIINENPNHYLTPLVIKQYGIKMDYTYRSANILINDQLFD